MKKVNFEDENMPRKQEQQLKKQDNI